MRIHAQSRQEATSGSQLTYGIHRTPYGYMVIALIGDEVAHLSFIDHKSSENAEQQIRTYWPQATVVAEQKNTKAVVAAILTGTYTGTVRLRGTPFQMKVWRALTRIPKGKTTTYQRIAESIGHPRAVRAVGSACGSNPVAYLIPCHRVVAANGMLGGYRWGLARKKQLLEDERKSVD